MKGNYAMNKRNLTLLLPLLLSITLNGCTSDKRLDNNESTASVNIKLLEAKESNKNSSITEDNLLNNSKESGKQIQDVQTQEQKTEQEVTPSIDKNQQEIKPSVESSEEASTPVEQPAAEQPKRPLVFKQGDVGEEIKLIQDKLNKFGHKLAADGIFGSSTYEAVLDFQMRNKISSDGIVGEETLAALEKQPTAETIYKAPPPPPKPNDAAAIEQYINSRSFGSKTNYFIWIDLANQRVNIFTGKNNNWKLERSMVCSSGKAYTPTIKGNYTVGIKGAYFIADGGARCKYYTQIKGNYLFHSVLYDNKGEKIIDGTLGVPVSHGCVRLATENAKYIYDNIPADTAIWSN
jgi:lipoprotein-anchoring transpeptidase ErfK/SrfK